MESNSKEFNSEDLNYKACGHYLIVELKEIPNENVSSGGILLSAGRSDHNREQAGTSLATILNVGPNCWAGFTDANGEWHPWCKEGDEVMLAQYAGQAFPVNDAMHKEEQEYFKRLRLIKDDDVLALLNSENPPENTPKESIGGNR